MNSIRKTLREWSGYSRRERRSTFILLIIMAAVIATRYLFPFNGNKIREIPIDFIEDDSERLNPVLIKDEVNRGKNSSGRIRETHILELNGCDSSSLVALPGIGPVLSSRIVKYRDLLGGYVSKEQLREVYGLPEETFDLVSQLIRADSDLVRKLPINEVDYMQLIKHPYLTREEVSAILNYRKIYGIIESLDVMIENNLISPETATKIRPYLEY